MLRVLQRPTPSAFFDSWTETMGCKPPTLRLGDATWRPSFIVSKLSMNSMAAWSALHLLKCHLSTHKLAVIYMVTARAIDPFPRTRYGCLRL